MTEERIAHSGRAHLWTVDAVVGVSAALMAFTVAEAALPTPPVQPRPIEYVVTPAATPAPAPAPEPAVLIAFVEPLPGRAIVSPFGRRQLPWEEQGRLHAGVDIAAEAGRPILASADVYRPAAIDQLKTLGASLGIPVLGDPGATPLAICAAARDEAAQRGLSPLILDTAGRLHIDEEMLGELKAIKREVTPHHVLLVVDAMTGQDAVTVADKFNAAVGVDAFVLTKMDGDARGGAALSVREITGPAGDTASIVIFPGIRYERHEQDARDAASTRAESQRDKPRPRH